MRKLGCNVESLLGNSIEQNMELVKKAGFDSTYFFWDDNVDIERFMEKAIMIGLEVEALQCSFAKTDSLWEEGSDGDLYTEKLRCCIQRAAKYKIPYVVLRATNSFTIPKTSHIGLMRYRKLVLEAEKHGVKLAFENHAYLRHLGLVFETFKNDNVGLCYDIGHEKCYTPGIRYMPLFGGRLFCTRIHDNFGLSPIKVVDPGDDLHKIPFDGSIDFSRICKEIKNCGYEGSLMLEVSSGEYNNLTPEQFYERAYAAAKKLCELTDGN